MDASPELRIVDLAVASARRLMVTRAPGPNTWMVAEHTLALIRTLARQFRPLSAAVAGSTWRGAATA